MVATDYKKILIVDDSEIDREVLKNILCNDFNIVEAENGYTALEIILKNKKYPDAILLDVSMPVLGGFDVLRIMQENRIENIPVFLITAEATETNVIKAAQYNISEFIRKPFDSEEILKRVRLKLNIEHREEEIVPIHVLTETAIAETYQYISKLEKIYNNYLQNTEQDAEHYKRISDLMRILLKRYFIAVKETALNHSHIEIISRAAYFCNIGTMTVPEDIVRAEKRSEAAEHIYRSHTVSGAEIIRLNDSKNCQYFIQVCADICMHHHERYDGKGFPHNLTGDSNSVYAQMCRLVDEFDQLFFKCSRYNELQFDYVIKELLWDKGTVSQELFLLIKDCGSDIIPYYTMISQNRS